MTVPVREERRYAVGTERNQARCEKDREHRELQRDNVRLHAHAEARRLVSERYGMASLHIVRPLQGLSDSGMISERGHKMMAKSDRMRKSLRLPFRKHGRRRLQRIELSIYHRRGFHRGIFRDLPPIAARRRMSLRRERRQDIPYQRSASFRFFHGGTEYRRIRRHHGTDAVLCGIQDIFESGNRRGRKAVHLGRGFERGFLVQFVGQLRPALRRVFLTLRLRARRKERGVYRPLHSDWERPQASPFRTRRMSLRKAFLSAHENVQGHRLYHGKHRHHQEERSPQQGVVRIFLRARKCRIPERIARGVHTSAGRRNGRGMIQQPLSDRGFPVFRTGHDRSRTGQAVENAKEARSYRRVRRQR